MALERLNYASGGERTDFSDMMSLLRYFFLKLNLHVGLLRTLKEITVVTYPFSCFSVHLPTCLQHGKD